MSLLLKIILGVPFVAGAFVGGTIVMAVSSIIHGACY